MPEIAVAPARGPRGVGSAHGLAAAIAQAREERGLEVREVVRRTPRRHVGTAYRIFAGRTTDPWISTVLMMCQGVDTDIDVLLGVEDIAAVLDVESYKTFMDVTNRLDEEDQWMALDMLRALLRRIRGGPSGLILPAQATTPA